MTKIILLALLVSLNSYAQSSDELTLESTTAPTIVEDGTDLSSAPAEEPVEAPDTVDITETVAPVKEAPAELAPKAGEEELITDLPEDDEPVAEVNAKEAETPNPTADSEIKPDEKPAEEKLADKTPPPAVSTPVITSEIPKDDRFIDHRKSHWISTYMVDSLKYKLPWDFKGQRKNFGERDQELYGPRLGFGGQLYLGAGFFTTSMVEGFYTGTAFTKEQRANPDVDVKVGSVKRTSGFYGMDASQSIGRIFEFKTKNPFMDEWAHLTFEPFVEAGIGVARGHHRVNYSYDSTVINEAYKAKIRDELTNARIGGGFNMTSRGGFFLQVRATVNRFDITKRRIDSYTKPDGQSGTQSGTITDKDAKIDPVTIVTIGGGYKF